MMRLCVPLIYMNNPRLCTTNRICCCTRVNQPGQLQAHQQHFFFAHPSNMFAFSLSPSPLFVTQTRRQVAGPSPPSPRRYVPSLLSREFQLFLSSWIRIEYHYTLIIIVFPVSCRPVLTGHARGMDRRPYTM